ncbi:MAG: thiamine phosphate synthase [Verrucomicrobiales bacterium]
MSKLEHHQLYTFIDTAYLHGRNVGAIARQLCDGGSDIIQLRAKVRSLEDVRRMAEEILPITTAAGVPLVINDHPSLARELQAPFCHLGQEDFFDAGYKYAQDLFPLHPTTPPLLGLSTHAPDQAIRAVEARPAYIAIGPIYSTDTKPTAKPVTLDYVKWAAANVGMPWFAIGGVNLNTIDAVLAAGATRVCVVSAILNSDDISGTCRIFKEKLLAVRKAGQTPLV